MGAVQDVDIENIGYSLMSIGSIGIGNKGKEIK